MDECVFCGTETPKNELWCDSCWEKTKSVMEKLATSKDMDPPKSENAKEN